jgi:uncharacterized membrane protein
MDSLFMIGLLLFLAGPILGIVALVQISGLNTKIAKLRREMEALEVAEPAAVQKPSMPPAPGTVVPVAEAEDMPLSKVPEAKALDSGAEQVERDSSQPSPPSQSPRRDVEKAIASRWFVWVGGAAVALGGLLFVKYAHDNGLIPPILRVVIGLVFGGALVAAGEWLRQRADDVAKSYVPAALSAAGLTISFGVVYAAYALYDILSPGVCFPLLVVLGLGALWLSRRQGPFIAALGLVGSYAAPALVPSDHPSAWGFFAFLLVIVAASLHELRNRNWWWLGFAALGGATAWALLWIHGGIFEPSHVAPTGLFALLMGAAATLIPRGRGILAAEMGTLADPASIAPPMGVALAGLAGGAVVLVGLVWQSQHGTLGLLLFAVGMLAITGFGWLRDGMVAAPLAAAIVSVLTLMAWPDVGFHEWAMDERGVWSTIPGKLEPFRFRNAMFLALITFTAVGLAGVFRRTEKRPWAALAAASAVVYLFGTWARADSVQPTLQWIISAALLVGVLTFVADRVKGRVAEILLVGTALLALFAIDRASDGVWQTLATAGLAATFALATRRLPLLWVAAIAAAIASLAAVRLFVGREFWGDPQGLFLGPHWVLYGYGIPAALFWLSSRWLKEDIFTRHRTALEGLALGLAISLVSLELRVLIGGGITTDGMGLLEMSAHALAWLGAAYGLAYRQSIFSSFVSLWGARVLLAASCLVFFMGLTVRNPVITGDAVEGGVFVNSLWLAYLAPVALLALMARKVQGLGIEKLRNGMGAFALTLLVAFVTLQVKRLFQDETLDASFISDAESYSVSAAWIATAIAIFVAGIGLDRQTIRLGGLAFLSLAIVKVLLFDLFELGGLWRIASVIGLGLCLIGVGWLYTHYVQVKKVEPLS